MIFICFSEILITNFFDERYIYSISTVNIIASSVYFVLVYTLIANFQFYFEKTLIISISTIFIALINIALNLIFIPKYGYNAASFSTLFSYSLLCFFHICFAKSICKRKNITFNFSWLEVVILPILFLALILFFESFDFRDRLFFRFSLILIVSVLFVIRNKQTLNPKFHRFENKQNNN